MKLVNVALTDVTEEPTHLHQQRLRREAKDAEMAYLAALDPLLNHRGEL